MTRATTVGVLLTLATAALLSAVASVGATTTLSVRCGDVEGERWCAHTDDVRMSSVPRPALTSAGSGGGDVPKLVCDGRDSFAVQAVWFRSPDGAPLSQVEAELQQNLAIAQQQFDRSSARNGGAHALLPRFVSDVGCTRADILEVVTDEGPQGFWTTMSTMKKRGLERHDRVYLVLTDDDTFCGVATFRDDDTAGPSNVNASRDRPSYARVDRNCFGWAEAHELVHAFGGVQPTSPNGTARAHCNDGHDLMCYADGSVDSDYLEDACPVQEVSLLDCGADDYFDPSATVSGYLSTHWNVADSPFLIAADLGATDDGGYVAGAVHEGLFDDVPAAHPFHDDIARLSMSSVTRGCTGDGQSFCPDSPVTRGQMAAFLQRALGLPTGTSTFADTHESIYRSSIAAIADAGITRGCNSEGTAFCPDSAVTRGQMAAFLTRALRLPAGGNVFGDVPAVHRFSKAASALANAGITRGCNADGTAFCPDDDVTRGEMAAFLSRAGLTT